ncbi:helix-turn-helix transcriptional regulator [Halogranum rubrum]|uniref:helix-turn-helix transcriptional regulator n=1 Tax=Halogranum rubrum TaxID=553466 RepID=UPI000677B5A1
MEAEPPQEELTPREQHALALIEQANGFYQSELWKALGVSSRTGTRIATALEAAGMIKRDPTVYNGRKTYRLTPTPQQLDFSLLMAGDEISPFISADEVDPWSEAFTHWLMELSRESAV